MACINASLHAAYIGGLLDSVRPNCQSQASLNERCQHCCSSIEYQLANMSGNAQLDADVVQGDGWIDKLRECKHLTEQEVKEMCDKVNGMRKTETKWGEDGRDWKLTSDACMYYILVGS